MRIKTLLGMAGTLALGLCGVPGALAANAAGDVMLITGRGSATNPADGAIRELAKGDTVFAGEIINSSVNSYINLKFADGSFVLLRPNTRFVIEDFALAEAAVAPVAPPPTPAAPPPATAPRPGVRPPAAAVPSAPAPTAAGGSRAFFRLLKGGFRAVSGLIGKADPNEYRVNTPVATIGIRGTDYVAYICDTACANDPVVREELPTGAEAEGGLVAGVVEGGIGVTTGQAVAVSGVTAAAAWLGTASATQVAAAGGPTHTELGPGQYMIVTGRGRHITLDEIPRGLIVNPIPNPTTVCPQ